MAVSSGKLSLAFGASVRGAPTLVFPGNKRALQALSWRGFPPGSTLGLRQLRQSQISGVAFNASTLCRPPDGNRSRNFLLLRASDGWRTNVANIHVQWWNKLLRRCRRRNRGRDLLPIRTLPSSLKTLFDRTAVRFIDSDSDHRWPVCSLRLQTADRPQSMQADWELVAAIHRLRDARPLLATSLGGTLPLVSGVDQLRTGGRGAKPSRDQAWWRTCYKREYY